MSGSVVLAVGGVDPSGGAGVFADLDAVRDHGLVGAAAVAAVTAQSSHAFVGWEPVAPALLERQLAAVAADLPLAALKIGMLGTPQAVDVLVAFCAARPRLPVVLDPVLVSTSGGALARDATTRALAERLLPRATIVTPNLAEAAALAGVRAFGRAGMKDAARALVEACGAAAVVVTGGDLAEERSGEVVDCLFERGGKAVWLRGVRVPPAGKARTVRGTGCRFATAIACGLARGTPLGAAVRSAKRYVARLIARRSARLGKGAAQVVPPRRRSADDED